MNHAPSSAVSLCRCVSVECARKLLTLREARMKVTLRASVWAKSRNLTVVFFQPHHKNNITGLKTPSTLVLKNFCRFLWLHLMANGLNSQQHELPVFSSFFFLTEPSDRADAAGV